MKSGAALNVTIYCRLSEDKHGSGQGVQRQEAECREWVEQRGWTVREVIVDNDLSATTGKARPGFEQLLASAPEAIICWHIDRLLRLTKDLLRVIDLGVNVYALQAGHLDLSTPAGRAVAKTVTAWSEYEGEQKALRQQSQHRQRVASGGLTKTGRPWWPTRPLGFNLDGSHHEAEAPALAQVYTDLLNGGTLAAATRHLGALGIVAERSGKPWRASSLRPVLLNARNAGIYVYNGEEVGPAAWEPIVSQEIFRAVTRILTDPSRRTTGTAKVGFGHRENLLTGFAKCVKCDHTVRAAWRRNKEGERTHKVYQCGGCHGTNLPADWADWAVSTQVFEHVEAWKDRLPSGADAAGSSIAELRVEQLALESRKSEAGDLFMAGSIDGKRVAEMTAKADARLAEIENELANHAVEAHGFNVYDIEALWEWSDDGNGSYDIDKFRPVIETVCKSITFVGPGQGNGRSSLKPDQNVLIEWTREAVDAKAVSDAKPKIYGRSKEADEHLAEVWAEAERRADA